MKRRRLLAFLLAFQWSLNATAEEIFQEIVVAAGDTMWSISNKYLKDPQKWPEIVKFNQLPTSDPTIALPGTKIRVPITLIKEEFRNAELVSFTPVVKYSRKGTDDWRDVNPNMLLKYEDSLRTLKGAQARVRFPSKEVVLINEDSYVVLKPEKILQEIRLMQGGVVASRAKVILPHGTVVKPVGANSNYQAKVREDQTEVVFVYKGKVDVTAQGKTVTVPEGFGTHIPKEAPPMEPKPLPQFQDFDINVFKEATAPTATLTKDSSGKLNVKPPSMDNGGKKVTSKSLVSNDMLTNYSLQIAKDKDFKQIIIEKNQSIGDGFDPRQQSIEDGTYYMRVAFIDALGVKGPYSDPSVVIKDTKPPEILNLMPEDGRIYGGKEGFADVSGTINGATTVMINGEVIFIGANGYFDKLITLKPGPNEILIYAKDATGNETTVKRKVTYKKN